MYPRSILVRSGPKIFFLSNTNSLKFSWFFVLFKPFKPLEIGMEFHNPSPIFPTLTGTYCGTYLGTRWVILWKGGYGLECKDIQLLILILFKYTTCLKKTFHQIIFWEPTVNNKNHLIFQYILLCFNYIIVHLCNFLLNWLDNSQIR